MSYDHVLLPSGAAATTSEVDSYLMSQDGQPVPEALAEIAAELNRLNDKLPEADAFLSDGPVEAGPGSALQVASPYDAIGHVRNLLFELATPRGYAVYDPQLFWLIDPAGQVPVAVSHGGAGDFPYLTKELAHKWVPELAAPGPYLIVEKADEIYVQTYRHDDGHYDLEYRDGSADRHFTVSLNDANQVADLIWDWANGDLTRFDALDWQKLSL
ncbi:hypothetical protein AB0N05_28170 [Nocardia sp. NPDC051030]|uniref:hypothetical protein n=1 Tax=Nocardia sp. NPDC051030 TaxID=3155162 RepID=UPI003425E2A8